MWSIIHSVFFFKLFVVKVLCLVSTAAVRKIKRFCLRALISAPASLVNKVHSLHIDPLNIYVLHVLFHVRLLSPRARRLPEYLPICAVSAGECVFTVHVQPITICECLYLTVCACMCVKECVCVWGTEFPGLLVIMFLGVMGGTWKPCAAQIKTNKEMMGAPLSPLWPGGPEGGENGRLGREGRRRRREGWMEGGRRRRGGGQPGFLFDL